MDRELQLIEDSMNRCRKLIARIEEDIEKAPNGLGGEILVAYQDVRRRQLDDLQEIYKRLLALLL